MVFDHPAVRIVAGIFLGGAVGVLAFASLRVQPSEPPPPVAVVGNSVPVAPAQPAAESVPIARFEAPVSVPGAPLWLPAPARERPVLVAQSATFPCASRKGASRVSVGWAVALFGKHPAARSKFAPATAAGYSTSLAWGGEGMSLAVSCSAGTAATPAANVAQAPVAPRPMVPLNYPAESQPAGLQVSGLFKPVTDAMP